MAVLRLNAPIVDQGEKAWMDYYGENGICFDDIDQFLSSMAEDDGEIDLRIHCPGGSVYEGWAIQDKLRASGKRITATIEGECASMASIVLLAASERRGAPHATILIHDPFAFQFGYMTADEMLKAGRDLNAERERMLDYYVERTGADRDTLDAMMHEETTMDMERARELGFIQEILEPLSASAIRHQFIDRDMAMKNIFKARRESNPKAYELNTADGTKITVERDEGDPQVGDKASPDGEHLMPDGKTIVISGGVITEIREADEQPEPVPDEGGDQAALVADLRAQVAQLTKDLETCRAEAQAEVADLHAEIEAKDAEIETLNARIKTPLENEVLNLAITAGGSLEGGRDFLADAKSNYRPEQRDVTRTPMQGKSELRQKYDEARRRNGMRVEEE
ncbi:MAG: ATP-dependent Clp protease proteolytic subunit [Prevotellaceae bacterium]|nr:ATP-dependent Clp protease proteolytic subunit [Prevotellaceae bacterium]